MDHAPKAAHAKRRAARTSAVAAAAAAALASAAALAQTAGAAAPSIEDLKRLSIEDLANIEVTSVFKRAEPVSRTPASVYVITSEDIRRSGAQSLPEALRLAPNLMVARRDARTYAISARGFNSVAAANKLLVLVDGRSVYTPLHGGVLWDQQQVMLEDVDRIEVISGPAGTAWGANAVNGVINVVTRGPRETGGGLASAHLGTLDGGASLRYGAGLGNDGAFRVYGLGFERGETVTAQGIGRDDDWRGRQAGFRADWAAGPNDFTVQGDLFDNRYGADGTIEGGNVLGRWSLALDDGSSLALQTYFDLVDRSAEGVADKLTTYDLDARHNIRLGDSHALVWGGGYRFSTDEFRAPAGAATMDPVHDSIHIANVFAQDTWRIVPDVSLTLGAKVEYSSYSGAELLPSVRVAWQLAPTRMVWAAVSRAVRTPSRVDRDLGVPSVLTPGGGGFGVEELIAYEVGYRARAGERATLSLTLYHHDYDELRAYVVSPATGLLMVANAMEGHTWGIEAWADYQATERWRLAAGFNLLREDFQLTDGGVPRSSASHRGSNPAHQFLLRSRHDLTDTVELDLILRAIDERPTSPIPDYAALDLRLGWRVTERIDLTLAGLNLLDARHPEAQPGANTTRGEIPRSVFAGARVRF